MSNASTQGHEVRLLVGGAEFFPVLIQAIDQSANEVRLETFIFHFEATGLLVAQALERAALRGVAVYLVVDGVGTPRVPASWQVRFKAAGVQVRQFSPLGNLLWLDPTRWRRLHRKLCVVDEILLFCGGINCVDDWREPGHGALEAPRYDFAVQVRGPVVWDALFSMTQLWSRLQIAQTLEHGNLKAAGQAWGAGKAQSQRLLEAKSALSERVQSTQGGTNVLRTGYSGVEAGLLLRDNFRNRARIERSYRHAIAHAKREIVIANAYFLPGRRLRRSLVHARLRGVTVKLLVQGRYDNFMQFHASRPVMASLLKAGIEVYEYFPSLLHAKVAVIDGQWATVGSSNLDPLSLLLAREANIEWSHAPLATELRRHLMVAIDGSSTRLTEARLAQRHWWHRVLDQIAFTTMRVTLFITGRRY